MATTTPQTEALEAWLRSNGAYLHPSIRVVQSEECGVHLCATEFISPGTTLASTPHRLALSYLNALVDDEYPFLRLQRHRLKVHVIGYFYLMIQYVHREQSFWKAYLNVLPDPNDESTHPIFSDNTDDMAWLEDTDALKTITERRMAYAADYQEGITCLQQSGIDTEIYTWQMFLWAVSMYTSRSFSSRTLRPQSGRYWAAYKTSTESPNKGRQAVLLDMSSTPADDLHFPVLFPGLDAANHAPTAKVDWTFDAGLFTIALAKPGEGDAIKAGKEVFNNYGPKGNGELLIGYGFALPVNSHDSVNIALKAPPAELQEKLRPVHPGYFTQAGDWNAEKTTFELERPNLLPQTTSGLAQRPQIFHSLPEPLLELLLYMIRNERNLAFNFATQPLVYLTHATKDGRRWLPHLARMIFQSLAPKLQALQSTYPSRAPQNSRQMHASIYRDSQIDIIAKVLTALKSYTRALIYRGPSFTEDGNEGRPTGNILFSLASFIKLLESHDALDPTFMQGIAANAGTDDVDQLRLAGWEEDIWVLLLAWVQIKLIHLPDWLRDSILYYEDDSDIEAWQISQGEDLLELVSTAASACPHSRWKSPAWSGPWIGSSGGKKMRADTFHVTIQDSDADRMYAGAAAEDTDAQGEARLFVHFFVS